MLHHECGVLGLFNQTDPARKAYLGLHALQHRGQESAGIFVTDGESFKGYKNFGLLKEVFDENKLNRLSQEKPCHALGHVRYSGEKDNVANNLQPMFFRHLRAEFAICNNGALLNSESLSQQLQEQGAIFQSTGSCEILAHLILRNKEGFIPALQTALPKLIGSYCFVMMLRKHMIAARDPRGFMPLVLGKLEDGYVVASESCALDILGADYIRDVEPGEILDISHEGLQSYRFTEEVDPAYCLMEYIYFARPDSMINGVNVHQARYRSGVELAREAPVDSDLVIGVPDSSLSATQGYAAETGLPLHSGLIKNKYSGRTFIEPTQAQRDRAVYMKLSPIRYLIEGKRVTLIDDSIVRGTTSRQLVRMMRSIGAKEVHLRIASPKMIGPCFYGVDSSDYDQLIGARQSVAQIAAELGADSLAYLSLEGLCRAIGKPMSSMCASCFNDQFRTPLCEHEAFVRRKLATLPAERFE